MNFLKRRGVRWLLGAFILLLVVLAVGRTAQIYLDSRPQGARGPYLQLPAPDGITVRWQTLEAQRGVVRFGTMADRLERVVEGPEGRIHEVRLDGLKPDTRYFYRVDGTVHRFRTAPLPGSERPLRLWVQGDPGRAIPAAMLARDKAVQWANAHPRQGLPPIDLWLTTGDNAYNSGKDEEFQKQLFNAYPRLLPAVPYLPTYGNHDARRNAFFQLFSFPSEGEAGGFPSGSDHYFALDYGQLHLVYLDTQEGDLEPGSDMLQWLQRDLAATQQRWIITLFHHPPYSKGSHDSDDALDSAGRMYRVRENLLPLLEQGGVDLVLSGHSHSYERSHLLACHYGTSDSFRPEMKLPAGSNGEYRKPLQRSAMSGTIYSVVGSSARADGGSVDHPAMAAAKREVGSLMIDISADTLSGYFINTAGEVGDRYRITKSEQTVAPPTKCE